MARHTPEVPPVCCSLFPFYPSTWQPNGVGAHLGSQMHSSWGWQSRHREPGAGLVTKSPTLFFWTSSLDPSGK